MPMRAKPSGNGVDQDAVTEIGPEMVRGVWAIIPNILPQGFSQSRGNESGDGAAEIAPVVVVDENGAEIGMAREALHGAYVTAGGIERGGDGGMAQRVRADLQPGLPAGPLDDGPEALSRRSAVR